MKNRKTQKELAIDFQKLHTKEELLVLPNVWNAGTAKIFEQQGFEAIATTSAGVAFSLGCSDGEIITVEDLTQVVKQITSKINIPLSVDIERGYSDTIEEIVNNVKQIIQAGAVGINIEDGKADGTLYELDFQLEKIKALVKLKQELDIPFVINARTCVYWLNIGDEKQKIKTAIERSNAFEKAGADCVFIPGNIEKETVKKFVEQIKTPVNIVLSPAFSEIEEMDKIGVKRLSIGSAAAQTICENITNIAKELRVNNVDTLLNRNFTYKSTNELFE